MTAQILSMTPGLRSDFGAPSQPIYLASGLPAMMDQAQQSNASSSPQDESSRGRRRTREDQNGDDDDTNGDQDNLGSGSSKKRRRSRKGLDKKFECPHEGCGKSYSRAEHLYRHQLNRTSNLYFISNARTPSALDGT